MWSYLDWAGILTSGDAPKQDALAASKLSEDSDDGYKKRKGDNDSDTGGETDTAGGLRDASDEIDTDSDKEGDDDKGGCCCCFSKCKCFVILLLLAAFAVAIFGGVFGKQMADEKKGTSWEGIEGRCSSDSKRDYETAYLSLSLEGMERTATAVEIEEVEKTVFTVYNNVSAGCEDVYERFMKNATVVNQTVIEDGKGKEKHYLTMNISTTIICDGCGIEEEIMFSDGNITQKKAEEDDEDQQKKKQTEDRKLKRGGGRVRGVRGSSSTSTTSTTTRYLKGDKSPNAQEFIDELDEKLQQSQLPMKKVKEGFVYKKKKSKDAKKGEEDKVIGKMKLVPKQDPKKKDKESSKKGPKDSNDEDKRRRRN
eukprot:scaffold1301_cov128-Cylindrotheca_fusiformis.AAC.4